MFKRKPIYIILLVVFTLLLAADIAGYMLTANISSNMPAMPGGTGMQSGFDGTMPETSDGTMPEFSSGRPDFGDGTMPEVSSGSGDTSGAGSATMPEGFDPSQMQGGFTGTGAAGTLYGLASFIGSWWIPIGIFCVLVDALCVFMLIRISKKRRAAAADSGEEAPEEEAPKARKPQVSGYEKRRRKRRRTVRVILIFLGIILVLAIAYVVVNSAYTARLAQESKLSVVSAEAASADIGTDISGTGTLTDADAEAVTVPARVEIAAYLVEDGDTVAEGDVLATVDHTTVMKAIADLQDAMDLLDEEIDAASVYEISSEITAAVDGRVKVIYAEEGTGVADTMYGSGALMLISLDGLMAADITTDASLVTGDSVTVALSDGTELKGRVASVSDGAVTVTVTDDSTAYGDTVAVTDKSGTVLGSGVLYIHSELKVTGYTGTADDIECKENEEVSAGDTLISLTDTEYTAEYSLLLEQRSAYEEEMMELFKLYQDGSIYAETAGTVSGINEETATGNTGTSQTEYTGVSETGDILADVTRTLFTVQSLTLAGAEEDSSDTLLGNNPSGADDTTVSGYTNYAATVSGVSYTAITLREYPVSLTITDYTAYASLGITSAMMTSEIDVSPAVSTPVYRYENGAWAAYSVRDIGEGDVLILTYDPSSGSGDPIWIVMVSKAEGSGGGSGTGAPTSGGTSGGSTTTTTETTEPEDLYAISDTTVMSVTPGDKMSVSVTIDELDILSLEVGQAAAITLDASGQTFTGSVTSIDTAGTNSGGSTKYTAVVTLERTSDMLSGMNAAVSITLSSSECTVTIPVAALVELETGVAVYTGYDEENDTLSDPVEVTTGLSDGTNVEILSGLTSGETIWYEYDDTIDISSSTVSSSGGGFNIMSIFGGRGGRD